jgi:site-specific DNA recombinase
MIIEGQTFTEIAEADGVSKRRIQAVIEQALLSPRTLDAIVAGQQPISMTSDYLIKTGFSANWSEQHNQFAKL